MPTLIEPSAVLWRACLAGDVSLIQQEISDHGADPSATDRNGETCLHMVTRSGNTKSLERLLQEGLHLDQTNHNGQTALHIAVNLDLLNMVKVILQHNGERLLGMVTKYSNMSALHLACRRGSAEIVKYLLAHGANCSIKDKIGKWPDFYTANKTIQTAFDKHFEVCIHGRRKDISLESESAERVTRSASGVAVIDDTAEVERSRSKNHTQQEQHVGDNGADYHHQDDLEYDENPPNTDAGTKSRDTLQRAVKKIRVNHKMDFSDQHKKLMQQNVFDRLLGKKK